MPSYKLYDTLGVPKGASHDQLKSAYKKLAVQNHPDKGGDAEKFKEISAAYNVLSDEQKRGEYDQFGDDGPPNGGGFHHDMNPHDLFSHFFGGMGGMQFNFHHHQDHRNHQSHQKCAIHNHDIHISLSEAYVGTQKNVKVHTQKVCFDCQGVCNACQGVGNITNMIRNGPFTQVMQRPCDTCGASGRVVRGKNNCETCQGTGSYSDDKKITIEIPKGTPSKGLAVNVPHLGEQPKRQQDEAGDLILHIVVDDDNNFKRVGNNLHLINKELTSLTFTESVLGKDIAIPHFSTSENLNINTKMFGIVAPGKEYIIAGKGMPHADNNSSLSAYGDLVISFDVTYPTATMNDEHISVLSEAFKAVGMS